MTKLLFTVAEVGLKHLKLEIMATLLHIAEFFLTTSILEFTV